MVEHLIACHGCDLVHALSDIPIGKTAYCSRCGSILYRPKRDSINRSLAFTLAGAILFFIANTCPFLGFKIGSKIRETTLASGIHQLYQQDMFIIASLVLFTVVLVPLLHILCMLYILIPLRFNRNPLYLANVFRLYLVLKPWGMLEIFMLGILVSAIKLVKMATIIPGTALYAFLALVFVLSAMTVTLDGHVVWKSIDRQ
ncbi:paraquat-inducible protein A [Desulfogranum marinum]|uniref:paraquat-inducible protein A n=1 Tax=Desulfogranum marinum TaxID=453220 RepID=UPI0019668C35|nr:paraquat-inducible protein A [Desulfogranum marinum]MBM9513963.1 paraquat-inducible protein A [Desulfogranum marinum]